MRREKRDEKRRKMKKRSKEKGVVISHLLSIATLL
jgi:hypothetical protein